MSKPEIIVELEAMVSHRLFGCHRWLADEETFCAVSEKLIKMGLVERISPYDWRSTRLGRELDIELFEVFLGLIDVWDVPLVLYHYGLIDAREGESLHDCTSANADPEFVLFGYVRRAYFEYHKATGVLH